MSNYTVKKGDGWHKIAKTLGVNVNDLLKANNATLDTMIPPGLILKSSKKQLAVRNNNLDKSNTEKIKTPNWELIMSGYTTNRDQFTKEFVEPTIAKTKTMSDRADALVKKRKLVYLKAVKKAQPVTKTKGIFAGDEIINKEVPHNNAILDLADQLYDKGYLQGNYDKVVSSTYNKSYQNALAAARQDGYTYRNNKLLKKTDQNYTPSNSPYALTHRALIGNIYSYDYNPLINMDKNNVQAYNEFLDLDLDTPEGLARANEILKGKQLDGKPIFSNRQNRNPQTLQKLFRERADALSLNAGQPQKYNSFNRFDDNGMIFYEYADQNINDKYASRGLATKNTYGLSPNNVVELYKYNVKYIPRDASNWMFNLYTIRGGEDAFGKYTEADDFWNLAPTEKLPGGEILPRILIRRYDTNITPSGTAEDVIAENSVYSGHSVHYNSNEVPREGGYPAPFSKEHLQDVYSDFAKDIKNKAQDKIKTLIKK